MENFSHFRLRKLIKKFGINASGIGIYDIAEIDYEAVKDVVANFGIRTTKTIQDITVPEIQAAWNDKHGKDYNTGVFIAALLLRGAQVDKALQTSISRSSSVFK